MFLYVEQDKAVIRATAATQNLFITGECFILIFKLTCKYISICLIIKNKYSLKHKYSINGPPAQEISPVGRKFRAACHGSRPGSDSKGVTSLIFRMARVSLYPMETDPVRPVQREEAHPQVGILGLGETVPLPFEDPAFIDRIHDIGGIAVDMHLSVLPFDGLKPLDDGKELHSVVGCQGKATRELQLTVQATKHNPVSSGTWIPACRTVSEQENGRSFSLHGGHCHSIIRPPFGLISVSGILTVILPAWRAS